MATNSGASSTISAVGLVTGPPRGRLSIVSLSVRSNHATLPLTRGATREDGDLT